MDDIVRQAMAKWPNVPDCYGWLGLDARGNWYMRDDRAQAAGPFATSDGGTPDSRGAVLRHDKLIDFIHRNYDCDDVGQWYFQNGPQRVYVDLEAAPYVWRVMAAGAGEAQAPTVQAHTGQAAEVRSAWLDEQGRLFLACELADIGAAFGLVHTLDMGVAADAVESGQWQPQEMAFAEMPGRFGYVLTPRP